MAYFTPQQENEYYNRLPGKLVGGSLVAFAPDGRVLITKPNYKPGWSPSGGVADPSESPLTAAIRELREEVGVDVAASRVYFMGVRWVAPHEGRDDHVQFMFGVKLTADEVAKAVPQKEEISKIEFVPPGDLPRYATHPRMKALLSLLQTQPAAAYIEDHVVQAATSEDLAKLQRKKE